MFHIFCSLSLFFYIFLQNIDAERRKGFTEVDEEGVARALHIKHDVAMLEMYWQEIKENIDIALRRLKAESMKSVFTKAIDDAADNLTNALWIPELHHMIGSNGDKCHAHHELRHECVEGKCNIARFHFHAILSYYGL